MSNQAPLELVAESAARVSIEQHCSSSRSSAAPAAPVDHSGGLLELEPTHTASEPQRASQLARRHIASGLRLGIRAFIVSQGEQHPTGPTAQQPNEISVKFPDPLLISSGFTSDDCNIIKTDLCCSELTSHSRRAAERLDGELQIIM